MKPKPFALSTVLALFTLASVSAEARPDQGIREAVSAFVKAGDAQDTEAAERVLHPEFRAVFAMGEQPEATLLGRDAYLGLLKAKKIGGDTREIRFGSTRRLGPIAVAQVTLNGQKARFSGALTLTRHDGRWKVVQDAVQVRPH